MILKTAAHFQQREAYLATAVTSDLPVLDGGWNHRFVRNLQVGPLSCVLVQRLCISPLAATGHRF